MQTVLGCVALGAVVGAALGAWLAPRLEISERVGRFNVGVAVFASCVGLMGLISATIVSF